MEEIKTSNRTEASATNNPKNSNQIGGEPMEPVHTSYSSYKDVTYRKCTPEEFRETTLKSMTAFAEAVRDAAKKAEAADK